MCQIQTVGSMVFETSKDMSCIITVLSIKMYIEMWSSRDIICVHSD